MSSAVVFLVIPIAAAIVGSILLWAVMRARRPGTPSFQEQLAALSPRPGSGPAPQPTGIVVEPDHDAER